MTQRFQRDNYTQTILSNHAQIPGEILLYGFTVYSDLASAQFVQLFDDGSSVPANGAVPAMTFPVAAHSNVSHYYGEAGRLCRSGLSLGNSTTEATKTAGAANCFFDIQYAHVTDPNTEEG